MTMIRPESLHSRIAYSPQSQLYFPCGVPQAGFTLKTRFLLATSTDRILTGLGQSSLMLERWPCAAIRAGMAWALLETAVVKLRLLRDTHPDDEIVRALRVHELDYLVRGGEPYTVLTFRPLD